MHFGEGCEWEEGTSLNPVCLFACLQVEIIDGTTLQTKKTISRFKDIALCSAFRPNV
jgi:hypothetical protein